MARIFGSESSPYSIKVRSYFRYKQIPHKWIARTMKNMAEIQSHSRLPIIPVVVTTDGEEVQDSTPIIEAFEQLYGDTHPIYPRNTKLRFLSQLLEEFGDEWANKWMFHFRWARAADQKAASLRIAREMIPESSEDDITDLAATFATRMTGRGFAVGSNPVTASMIEANFRVSMQLFNTHLSRFPFLLGGQPSFADFGLGAQVYQALTDPTCGGSLRSQFQHVVTWCTSMLDPGSHVRPEAAFAPWSALEPTLSPILRGPVRVFLVWSAAVTKAMENGDKSLSVDIGNGDVWTQTLGGPQKYHVRSLRELRRKYASIVEISAEGTKEINVTLQRCGCLAPLLGGEQSKL
eukprot:m.86253 g.86253  ORF g.86253 m.86253 type:complete len:349 (-) comp16374_c1_seq3:1662-2708(-)